MKIVFMGTPDFAVPSLQTLLNSNYEIPAVVTVPDKPKGRGLKLSESAVKTFAAANNLKILQPHNLMEPGFIYQLRELQPDIIVVVAFRILPEEVYSIPPFGSFNLHASLLPKYRGAAPINWAIINGENQTGVTTFFLQKKVDTGSVILQKKIFITDEDDAGSVHHRLSAISADAVLETIKLIQETKGTVPAVLQDESLATTAPKIFKEDCRIKWDNPARKVFNLIRGLAPYPGAFTYYNGKLVKILKAKFGAEFIPAGSLTLKSAQLFASEGRLAAFCRDGPVEILELQFEGKKRMTAKEFLNGNKIIEGAKFN